MSQPWFEMYGDVDVDTAAGFEEDIRSWLQSGGLPILDLRAVTFIDSTGLNMLARLSESLDRPLILQGVMPTVVKLLHLTGLDRHFTIAQ